MKQHHPVKPPKFSLEVIDKAKPLQEPEEEPQQKQKKASVVSQRTSKLSKTIDDAIDRMKQASQSIEVSKQQLGADLFLQQQKEKRLEYARNLNAEFEKQRKLREKNVYKEPAGEKAPLKKYLNELPTLRKYFIDPSEDDPFIIESHSNEKLQEATASISAEEIRTAEQQAFAKVQAGRELAWERIERLADDSTKCHFALLSKSG